MELKFPLLNGGAVSGLNDAGIETFEGGFESNVVRECAQNSLDPALTPGHPVRLEITRHSLGLGELPFLPSLREVLDSCRLYWDQHDKARKFFDLAKKLASSDRIDAIRISDGGTTGVDGTDDDLTSRWFGLVKSRGVSNKSDAGSGGAFGIGKDAPLAGSAFRTVLYSTFTISGAVAFQGVARLVTHKDSTGDLTQGTGFIGEFEPSPPSFRALREREKIPAHFLRTTPGLDIWILGSRHSGDSWDRPFICSALSNFWPAVQAGKITFVIGSREISQINLADWMNREASDPGVSGALPFYRAVVDSSAKSFERSLRHAGTCRLHLLLAKEELPRKVCMVRKTGMVIDYYSPRVGFLPFSGLFVCEDPEGNRLLKSLEPPRHDKWDPSRGDESKPRSALTEIKDWIRGEIKNLIPHFGADEFNETELPPDLLEPEHPDPDDLGADGETDLGGRPAGTASQSRTPIRLKPLQKGDGQGTEGGADEPDDDVENPRDEGDGKSSGGKPRKHRREQGERSLKERVPSVQTRAFQVAGEPAERYNLSLRCNAAYSGFVNVEAVTEDGSTEPLDIERAAAGEQALGVEGGNRIGPVQMAPDEPLRVQVYLKRGGKYSLSARLT